VVEFRQGQARRQAASSISIPVLWLSSRQINDDASFSFEFYPNGYQVIKKKKQACQPQMKRSQMVLHSGTIRNKGRKESNFSTPSHANRRSKATAATTQQGSSENRNAKNKNSNNPRGAAPQKPPKAKRAAAAGQRKQSVGHGSRGEQTQQREPPPPTADNLLRLRSSSASLAHRLR
jgi:hypothetical protein